MAKRPTGELWYPIDGYDGWYEVSNMGRVRSVDRVVHFRNDKGSRFYRGQLLKFRYHNGYAMVNLNKNKSMREYYVHRLVIENFTLHPRHRPWVNHKNGKKWDDRLENLEWCTPAENNEHACKHGLRHNNVSGILENNKRRQKPVEMRRDGVVHTEPSALDMAKYLILHHLVPEDSVDRVRYAVRYASQSGRIYYNMSFKYVS